MAMNLSAGGSGEPDVMIEMNMTPLIDVMLVLIIMLIITIPIQNHAVNLNMPNGAPPPSVTPPTVVNIDIDFDSTILWNGEVVPDYPTLEAKLREVAAVPDQPEVHLRPNKLVAYKTVAAVMAAAQRNNVTKIGMVGNEQFVD
jgi:biopolymer transport protein ExbD